MTAPFREPAPRIPDAPPVYTKVLTKCPACGGEHFTRPHLSYHPTKDAPKLTFVCCKSRGCTWRDRWFGACIGIERPHLHQSCGFCHWTWLVYPPQL